MTDGSTAPFAQRCCAARSTLFYTRLIGYSPGAGFVLTVIIDPVDASGVTAWKTRGADLRDYLSGKEQNL